MPRSTIPGEVTAPVPVVRPADSPKQALSELLAAEQRLDRTASFALVSPKGRTTYKDLPTWVRRRNELPAITAFSIDSATGPTVVALVEHTPGLDAFVGLRAAKERQTWTASKVDGGWLLDADPDIEPILPPDDAAVAAATTWTAAVQRCDKSMAMAVQAVDPLIGDPTPAGGLCGSTGAVTVGPVGKLPAGPASAAVLAQYTSDALEWARTVPVTAPVPFGVVLAPIGDAWRVIAVYAT